MNEPTVLAEQVAVPIDDEPEIELDCKYLRTAEELAAEFAAGELNESDFEQPRPVYPPDYAVLLDAPELPEVIEPAGPEFEPLLNQEQAVTLLDLLTGGEWRRLGRPPMLRASGVGWVMSAWSEFDLREWVRRRTHKSTDTK